MAGVVDMMRDPLMAERGENSNPKAKEKKLQRGGLKKRVTNSLIP